MFTGFITGNAQLKLTSVTPSAYVTYGDYNNSNSSLSLAGYANLEVNYFDYLNFGFDRLLIDNPEWKYTQHTLVAGIIKNYYPFYLSLNYLYLSGKLNWKSPVYSYSDNLHYIGAGINYNYNLFYFGGSFHWMNLEGYKSVVNRQYELSAAYLATSKLTIILNPMYSDLTDGRKLWSVGGELIYNPFNKFGITISGFIGERAYYFNNRLLVIFNQDETQKNLVGLKAAYSFHKSVKATIGMQHTEFGSYSINYFIFGISKTF